MCLWHSTSRISSLCPWQLIANQGLLNFQKSKFDMVKVISLYSRSKSLRAKTIQTDLEKLYDTFVRGSRDICMDLLQILMEQNQASLPIHSVQNNTNISPKKKNYDMSILGTHRHSDLNGTKSSFPSHPIDSVQNNKNRGKKNKRKLRHEYPRNTHRDIQILMEQNQASLPFPRTQSRTTRTEAKKLNIDLKLWFQLIFAMGPLYPFKKKKSWTCEAPPTN